MKRLTRWDLILAMVYILLTIVSFLVLVDTCFYWPTYGLLTVLYLLAIFWKIKKGK